jgi:hypothetical protein
MTAHVEVVVKKETRELEGDEGETRGRHDRLGGDDDARSGGEGGVVKA